MNLEKVPPQFGIMQLGLGFANTAVLYTLVKTGVIEQMHYQPQTLPVLAESCGLNPDVLYRILRFAAVIGVVELNEGQYSLTETGTLLLKDVPGSFYLGILLFGSEPWQRSWQDLAYSLTTGDGSFEHAMGSPFFEYLDKHLEYATIFNQWMTILTMAPGQAITAAYDFTPFHSVCDIGGGQGFLLKNILMTNSHLSGILFDQEAVLKDHILADKNGRVEIQAGSFFERVPSADVLVIKSVLHDWSDDKCHIILDHCREIMQPASRLLIIDRVIESPTDLTGAFFDLHMQVLAGGRERTESEFSSLLQKAGLKLNRIIPTGWTWKIVEASI